MYTARIPQRIYPSTFVAIDFETATISGMACQVGLVEVCNGEIVREQTYMIKPPMNDYDAHCMRVHHITPAQTESSPTFAELWMCLSEWLEDRVVIAHNSSFDSGVLKKNLSFYHLSPICPREWICTCEDLGKASLYSACKYFDIPLDKHHNAVADARAAAQLYLKYCKMPGEYLEIPKLAEADFRTLSAAVKRPDLEHCKNCNTIFYGKRVVITGVFDAYPEREALAQLLKDYGADINTSISKKTDIVVVGVGAGPKKLQTVAKLNDAGATILLLNEAQLLNELKL